MYMKNTYLLFIAVLLFTSSTFSQNARFSQLWAAPIQFNPSLTGRFDGQIRFGNLNSWQTSSYRIDPNQVNLNRVNHQNFTLDIKIGKYRSSGDERPSGKSNENYVAAKDPSLAKFTPNKGYWSIGLNYYHYGHSTSSVDGKFYSGSIARHFYSLSNRYFGFGGQMTYAVGDLNTNRGASYYYDMEINGGGFHISNQLTKSKSKGIQYKVNYIDYNGGAYYGLVTESVMFEVAYAMSHLFYPFNAFKPDADKPSLRHRTTASTILRVKLNNKFGLIQRNIYWKEGMYLKSRNENGDSSQSISIWAGVEFIKTNPVRDLNMSGGLYFRSFRTIIPYLNINLNRAINLRYSYETTVFSAKKYTAYTAKRHELAVILYKKRYTTIGTKFYKKLNLW